MAQHTWDVRSGEDLGRAIAGARAAAGLTQAEVAASVNLDRTYLARLEAGLTVKALERSLRILRRLGAHITVQFGPGEDHG